MKILMDTNIVSYWHSGHPKFRVPLGNYVKKLKRKTRNLTLYVSAVTIQELACWSKPHGEWEKIRQWLRDKFAPPLTFCELCANQAADMQVRAGPTGKMSETDRAQWHHDAAIVGTAAHHELDVVLTADRAMHTRYSPFFSDVVHIAEVGS
jgi:predicted nucleic acid-binding protein